MKLSILFVLIFVISCASTARLKSPEGKLKYKMNGKTFSRSYTYTLRGRSVINKKEFVTNQVSFIKGSILVETYINTTRDDTLDVESGKYRGLVTLVQTAYKILKTSSNEMIVKVAEYKSKERDYFGRYKNFEKWQQKDMGKWRQAEFKLSAQELESTYHVFVDHNASAIEMKLISSTSPHERFYKMSLPRVK